MSNVFEPHELDIATRDRCNATRALDNQKREKTVNDWEQQNDWQEQNDWESAPENADDGFAPGLSGGVYEPTLEDVIDNVQTLAKRVLGPLLVAWGAVAIVHLVLVILQTVAQITMGPASLAFMFVSIPVMLLVGIVLQAFRLALYRPMRGVMTDGPGAYPDLGSLKDPIVSNFVNVLLANLLYGLAVGVGALFCLIPGLVAAVVFAMAPYYAANGTPPVDAMRDSLESAKRYPVLFIAAVGAAVIILGVIQAVVALVITIIGSALGEYGVIVSNLTQWMMVVALGAIIWVTWGATFITIDLAESGEQVAQ